VGEEPNDPRRQEGEDGIFGSNPDDQFQPWGWHRGSAGLVVILTHRTILALIVDSSIVTVTAPVAPIRGGKPQNRLAETGPTPSVVLNVRLQRPAWPVA
jgi:hypothetical protein